MRKIPKFDRGFTLLELIMYMGIFSMVLLVLVQIFGMVLDVMGESQAKSSVSQDAEFINLRLGFDIKRAGSVLLPSELGGESQNLQIVINGENYSYLLTDGKLQLTNNSGTNDLSGFDITVSNLNFKRVGNEGGKDTVIISFTLSSKTLYRGQTEVKSFRTAFGLR